MTEDHFEKLSALIKWVHDDLSAEMDKRFETMEQTNGKRFDKIESDISYILTEVRDIRRDINFLKEKIGDHSGYVKEIDHVLSRVAAIEKHLGLTPSAMVV